MPPHWNWFLIVVLGVVPTAATPRGTGSVLVSTAGDPRGRVDAEFGESVADARVWVLGFDFVYEPLPWLKLDLDGDFRHSLNDDDDADRMTSAMREAFAGGAALDAWRWASGDPRFPYFVPQPLVEEDSEDATVRIAYRITHGAQLKMEVFNLFAAEATDIDYFYPPLVPGELPGVDDLHRQPFKSQGVRVFVEWRF